MQGALPLVLTRRLLALVATLILAPTLTYTVFTALSGTLGGLAGIWDYVVQTFWHFDLGVSSRYRVPLTQVIAFTWPMDLAMVLGGVACGMALGLAGGV